MAKLIPIRELLEDVTIAKVDLSPSGGYYRLWRKAKRSKGGDADGLMLVCEIHTGHIFDHLGRYVLNDIEDVA